jgi:hypothetical protein
LASSAAAWALQNDLPSEIKINNLLVLLFSSKYVADNFIVSSREVPWEETIFGIHALQNI